jgi:hypothetical protein
MDMTLCELKIEINICFAMVCILTYVGGYLP